MQNPNDFDKLMKVCKKVVKEKEVDPEEYLQGYVKKLVKTLHVDEKKTLVQKVVSMIKGLF
jgi:hypothetical protein